MFCSKVVCNNGAAVRSDWQWCTFSAIANENNNNNNINEVVQHEQFS